MNTTKKELWCITEDGTRFDLIALVKKIQAESYSANNPPPYGEVELSLKTAYCLAKYETDPGPNGETNWAWSRSGISGFGVSFKTEIDSKVQGFEVGLLTLNEQNGGDFSDTSGGFYLYARDKSQKYASVCQFAHKTDANGKICLSVASDKRIQVRPNLKQIFAEENWGNFPDLKEFSSKSVILKTK